MEDQKNQKPVVRVYADATRVAKNEAGAICVAVDQRAPLLAATDQNAALLFAVSLAQQNGIAEIAIEPGEASKTRKVTTASGKKETKTREEVAEMVANSKTVEPTTEDLATAGAPALQVGAANPDPAATVFTEPAQADATKATVRTVPGANTSS